MNSVFLIKIMCVVWIFSSLTACNLMQRHPDSGYSNYGADPNYDPGMVRAKQNHRESMAREELGYGSRQKLGEGQQAALRNRLYLAKVEDAIPTVQEKKQYYTYKAFLRSDRERIYFLKLPSMAARESYVQRVGISPESTEFSPEITDVIDENDITVGMSQKAVLESWGDPETKEIAGNPIYGNERWLYSKYVSSESGYRREQRFVYFENRKVVGWEVN